MEKNNNFIYWAPRILSILFLIFLTVFSLDVFDNNYNFWQIIIGLFMHNIPVFILAMILWISWKYEIVGGIGYILFGLLYIMSLFISRHFEWYMLSWPLLIAGPAFLIGVLFLIGWYGKNTEK